MAESVVWFDAPYTTRRAHGKYPVGSVCRVGKTPEGCLVLQFADGEQMVLTQGYYAPGVSAPEAPHAVWFEPMLTQLVEWSGLEPGYISERFFEFEAALRVLAQYKEEERVSIEDPAGSDTWSERVGGIAYLWLKSPSKLSRWRRYMGAMATVVLDMALLSRGFTEEERDSMK